MQAIALSDVAYLLLYCIRIRICNNLMLFCVIVETFVWYESLKDWVVFQESWKDWFFSRDLGEKKNWLLHVGFWC